MLWLRVVRHWIFWMLVIAGWAANCFAQPTFNQRYHFDWPLAVGNSLCITDSSIYFSGLIADSLPPYREGIIFGELDSDGHILSQSIILDSLLTFENWRTPLLQLSGGQFISVGYGRDSVGYAYWMKLSPFGTILDTTFFRSYYFPADAYNSPRDFIILESSQITLIVCEVGNIQPNGGNNVDYSITLINEFGDILAEYVFGTNWMDRPRSLLQVDNQIIIGSAKNNANNTAFAVQSFTRLEAIDISGQSLWTWQSENDLQGGALDMLAKPDKSLVICGMRGSMYPVNPSIEHLLWDRGLIFELDSNLNVVWETEMRTPVAIRDNKLNHLVLASDGEGYVAAGNVGVPEEDTLLGWLVKVSTEGDSLWSRYLRSYDLNDSLEYWHEVSDLQVTPDGGYILTGRSSDYEQLTSPITQAWFIKVDEYGCLNPGCQLVDTEEVAEEGPPLSVYPNPATDQLQVYIGATGGRSWQLALYDQQGRRLRSYEAPTDHTTYMLPVYDLPAGAYWLQVLDDSGRRVRTVAWVKGD